METRVETSVELDVVGETGGQVPSPLLLVALPPRSLSAPELGCRLLNGSRTRPDEHPHARLSRFASSLALRFAASRAARAARRAPSGPVTQATRRTPSGGGLARAVQGGGSSDSSRSTGATSGEGPSKESRPKGSTADADAGDKGASNECIEPEGGENAMPDGEVENASDVGGENAADGVGESDASEADDHSEVMDCRASGTWKRGSRSGGEKA